MEWVDVRTMLKADNGGLAGTTTMPPLNSEIYTLPRTTALAIKLMVATGVGVGELTQKLEAENSDGKNDKSGRWHNARGSGSPR